MRAGERVGELQRLLGMTREEAEEFVREEAILDAVADERARIRRLALDEARRHELEGERDTELTSRYQWLSKALSDFAALLEANS